MRRSLGSLLLAVALAASVVSCGDDDASDASDASNTATDAPASSSAPTTSPAPTQSESGADGTVDAEVVELVTETAVGGEGGTAAVLTDPAALSVFLGQFTGAGMTDRLQQLLDATEVPEGKALYAAVVAIGCDAPDDVTVSQGADGLVVEAGLVKAPKAECLAAMTTVAVLLVPADAV